MKELIDDQTIDLLNVAFENPRAIANAAKQSSAFSTPDRITGLASHAELISLRPHRNWQLIQVNVPYSEFLYERAHIVNLMLPNNTTMDLVSAVHKILKGPELG